MMHTSFFKSLERLKGNKGDGVTAPLITFSFITLQP